MFVLLTLSTPKSAAIGSSSIISEELFLPEKIKDFQ
jgi:hypothetical protein